MIARSAQPLLAIEAVALDIETTGLDPARARIVQVGAIALSAGRIAHSQLFEALVDPGEPIPPATTAIHGITDTMVVGAAKAGEVIQALEAFRAGRLYVGHNLGFDMAVLRREAERAGLAFAPPPFLDTRLLGEVAFPNLAGYTLEILASRLSIPVDPDTRHGALPDATTAARVYLALVPALREKGLRTLGEADEACRARAEATGGHARAGWAEPRARGTEEQALARIDAYPFRHRVGDLMARPPLVVPPETTLLEAARLMMERRVSSVFIAPAGALDALKAAIVTERDVMRAVAAGGASVLEGPVLAHASVPLATVPAEAFVYRALGRMDRLRIRHLGVVNETGVLVGALSARDLLKVRASDALALGDAVDAAESPEALAEAFARVPAMARKLVDECVPARDIAAIVSREIGATTRRAAALAEFAMVQSGRGGPPARYAVLVLGSVGRGESLLAADQDNALVWCDPEADGDAGGIDAWFQAFGERMSAILDQAGVALCKGGVMASNAAFRGPLSLWRARVEGWLSRNRVEDLLAVDIFYDFRPVAGEMALARRLFEEAYAASAAAPVLAKMLAGEIEGFSPPLGILGGIKLQDGRVDLKKGGLFPIVAGARAIAMRHGLALRGTGERLAAAIEAKVGAAEDLAAFDRAHNVILDAILRQQLADIATGKPPSSRVDPSILEKPRRRRLAAALRSLTHAGAVTRDVLFK